MYAFSVSGLWPFISFHPFLMQVVRTTEQKVSVDENGAAATINADSDYVEIYNKGPDTAYFRTDGTTPTAGAAGNADEVRSGPSGMRMVPVPGITSIDFINSATETSELIIREIYTQD